MKVLLIYPYFLEDRIHADDIAVVPQGLFYVGAVLRENNFEVEILNWYNINKTPDKINQTLIEKNPDIIGFSILNANRWGGIEIARIAKQINPKIKIAFGGIGATFLWEHFLTHFPEIDYVVIGEGEYSFLNLVDCLKNNDNSGIEIIKGIAFRKNDKPVKTKPAEIINNLDKLPMPAKYFDFQHLSLTRGCPGKCTFCGSPGFWGEKIRFYSIDYFVNQLERLYQKGIAFFYFSDDTFTISKKRVIEICRKILEKRLKIAWVAISRANYVNDEIVYWMKKAGCIQISYGVESGSETIRNSLNKNISTQQIKKAFSITLKYGILARAYFIYGCPRESQESIEETINLIREIKPLNTIFYILDIFPGTRLYEDYKKKNNLTDDIWLKRIEDIMYFETDPKLSKKMILEFGEKLRTSYYKMLPEFVDSISLIDQKELYPMHADFLSRLAMTFDHGDYSAIESIKGKEKIADKLYNMSLDYHPDPRAYLGLGIAKQKAQNYKESIEIITEGFRHFPGHQQLSLCIAISYMNLERYDIALTYLHPFQDSKEVLPYIKQCHRVMAEMK
ncbi:MAG: B12-binding domain-containing radical SAM protein [Desulfobacterales bacterium]|nr:B12-binding domain-containing radical SAM protein [Deltaproteobacteria bacterium]NNL42342.1 B12-binding domain-containing radical SAM protein [Desulfobacterales bacterium]